MKRDVFYPLRRLHGVLNEAKVEKQKALVCQNRIKKLKSNRVLFVFTPTHGNLGDHAIAEAGKRMLNEIGVEYEEIVYSDLVLLKKNRMLGVMNGRPIIVNGGGNLGTLWPKVEQLFRDIIKANPNSPIICLPNTIFYEVTKKGKRELEKSIKIYNGHRGLTLYARELMSFNIMKSIYKKVLLAPDLVLFMDESKEQYQRSGCLICLRRDIEKTRSNEEEACLREQIKTLFGNNVLDTDMNIGRPVSIETRQEELKKKFDEFKTAELVITDRLHGMLFCAITGTPCIVIDSKSPKIRGCYEWINNLEYIKFADDIKRVSELYCSIPKRTYYYNRDVFEPSFNELKMNLLEVSKVGNIIEA